MRIFLDANVIVSVLNKEYPLFSISSRILSLADRKEFEVFTSPICLAIAFYFAEKKNKRTARGKMEILAKQISISPVTGGTVKKTIGNDSILDFEDGLEYYSAIESKCKCIITEDIDDFYFSEIEVLDCSGFFEKYLVNKS